MKKEEMDSQPNDEHIRDKLNLQYNVHRHLDRMSSIITNPQLNQRHYNWAIDHLFFLLEPYGDSKFNGKLKEIRAKHKIEMDKSTTTDDETKLIKERNEKILTQLSYLIKRLRLGLETEGSEDIGEEHKRYNK